MSNPLKPRLATEGAVVEIPDKGIFLTRRGEWIVMSRVGADDASVHYGASTETYLLSCLAEFAVGASNERRRAG
jgi:hypothetical protein